MTAIELKKYIYKENKIEYILQSVGCHHIKYHHNNRCDYITCANPDGDNTSAVNIYLNEYLNCVNNTRNIGDGADFITLIQYYKKYSFANTIKFLHKLLGLKLTYNTSLIQKKEFDPLAIFKKVKYNKNKCNVLDFNIYEEEDLLYDVVPYIHIDFFKEGITSKTIKQFNLGYNYKYKRTIIPLRYWLDGSLLGTNARTSIQNYEELNIKKYYLTPSYPKSINLYGLWENRKSIEKQKKITIFEAEKSVLKRHSRLDETGVALSGHTISDEQIRIILGLNVNEIIIALDKDIDINEIRFICEKFYRLRKVSYIYDKYDLLQPKDSPADANNKIYNYLYKHRIVYDEKEHNKYLKWINNK